MDINNSAIKTVMAVGQIIMYGTLVMVIDKVDDYNCSIDVWAAPEGYGMEHYDEKKITERLFFDIINKIVSVLSEVRTSPDNGNSGCYIEVKYKNGESLTFTWPKSLHSDNFRIICKTLNSVVTSNATTDFLDMF